MTQRSHGDIQNALQANVARFNSFGLKGYASRSSSASKWDVHDFLHKSNSNQS